MKRLICFIIALVMAALTLASCDTAPEGGDGTGDGDGLIHGSATGNIGEFAIGGGFSGAYVWGDFMFIEGSVQTDSGVMSRIVFRDITDPKAEWVVLDCDFAQDDIPEGFDASIEQIELVVDDEATAENGGVPVFAVVYTLDIFEKSNVHNRWSETRVATFDMKTQKLTIIKSGIDGSLCSNVCSYKGRLYFDTQPFHADEEHGEFFRTLNMFELGGGEYATMDGFDTVLLSLDYIADDVIYYSRGGKIYSSALDFSGFTYLFDGYSVCCSDGEYLYYQTAEDLTMTDYDTAFSLCRRKLGDPLSEEETVLSSDVVTARYGGGYSFGDGYFYYDNDMSDGTTVFYSYDCRTGEHKKIFTAENSHYWIVSATDDRVIIQDWDGVYHFVKKDTGEYTTIVRWHNA